MNESASGSRIVRVWQHTVGPALAGPLAVLICLPLLVLVVGLVIGFTGRNLTVDSIRDLAEARFRERAEVAAAHAGDMFDAVDPAMDGLRAVVGEDPLADTPSLAAGMRRLLDSDPAVAYVGYGTANGDYLGVTERNGQAIFTERISIGDGLTRLTDYRWVDAQRLEAVRHETRYPYQPASRPWFLAAVQAGGRSWTDPYVWHDSGVLGVACSEPVTGEDGDLRGVLCVECNLNSLSDQLAATPHEDGTSLIFTDREVILALPGLHQQERLGAQGQGEVPTAASLGDPMLGAFFRQWRQREDTQSTFLIERPDERLLATVHTLSPAPAVQWHVATIGSLERLLAPAEGNLQRALIITGIALGAAVLIALAFARHLVRTHMRAARAEKDAAQAEDTVRRMGAYQLIKRLGEGGMGEVWLARHSLLARPVALKLVHERLAGAGSDEGERTRSLARFEREARIMAGLRSINTITLYDFGVTDEQEFFYVMELLDGLDLHDLVEQHGPQPLGRVVLILKQAASSLAEAHDHSLVHRDTKPANIYLCRIADELDVVKVLDFGMVRPFIAGDKRITVSGSVEGTPAFMAPEQAIDQEEIDGRADIYALACVAWFLITGREVYERDTPMATLMAHVRDEVPDLQKMAPYILPEELVSLLTACLQKNPDDRPPDMRLFSEALESIPLPQEHRWTSRQRRQWWRRIKPPEGIAGSLRVASVRSLHRKTVK